MQIEMLKPHMFNKHYDKILTLLCTTFLKSSMQQKTEKEGPKYTWLVGLIGCKQKCANFLFGKFNELALA